MPIPRRVTFESSSEDEPPASSPFRRALDEYVERKRAKKKNKLPQFITDLQASEKEWTKIDVQKAIAKLEQKNSSQRSVTVVRKVLKPIITVLSNYSGLVDSLAQADPMPTSVIWGCLRVVVNSSSRFLELYDSITKQLKALEDHLKRLDEYGELFEESINMQDLLQRSYVNVIRFWYRVEKECKRCIANRAIRSLASFSTSKLQDVVDDIEEDAKNIERLVVIVQERKNRGERENAAEERRLAGLARDEQAARHELLLQDRRSKQLQDVRQWLQCGSIPLNQSNSRHHQDNINYRSPDTCLWLLDHAIFSHWVEAESDTNVWLRASPGMGKSVLCSFAIDHVSSLQNDPCCVYQYYSFDEEFTPLQVYRNLAGQLVDRLWSQSQEIPGDLHSFTEQSGSCLAYEDAKTVIKMIVARFPRTYLFLDGLDEECKDNERWRGLLEVLNFFHKISGVRIWCSSQDRARLRPMLDSFALIEINKNVCNKDIEHCLSIRVDELEELELDPGTRALILQDLVQKADGCFLLASLILDHIADAQNLSHVQKAVQELPNKYEEYYRRKIDSIKPSERQLACQLLACVVYARRPLRLDELSEATAAANVEMGKNIDQSQKLFKSKILKLCEPLVQVEEMKEVSSPASVCTLTHGSVREFLLANTDLLSSDEPDGLQVQSLTEDVMGGICLKYLRQPAYQKLLIREEDAYRDANGVDILETHLLSYAAKYWDKHLDSADGHRGLSGCEDPESFCYRVKQFLQSPQFLTCLQVQSLLVEGQFSFWYSAGHEYFGPHTKRVFPRWLAERCFPEFALDYQYFVGEWGYLLDEHTRARGSFAGEIDRCFWTALGPRHFLRNSPSRYESFMFSKDHSSADRVPQRYYDFVNEAGNSLVVLKLQHMSNQGSQMDFECQSWKIGGRDPELVQSQKIHVERSSWCLYEHPVSERVPGRSLPVDMTEDHEYLRIASHIFTKSSQGIFEPLNFRDCNTYVEDVAGGGHYLAISRRKMITEKDLYDPQEKTELDVNRDFAEYLALKLKELLKSQESDESSTNTTTASDNSSQPAPSSRTSVSDQGSKEDTDQKIEDFLESGGLSESDVESNKGIDEADDEDLDLENSTTESNANSAEMSWSEGSTQASSELDDDDDWNDWEEKHQVLEDLDDSEASTISEPDVDVESEVETSSLDDGIEVSGTSISLRYRKQRARSPGSSSDASREIDDDEEDEGDEEETGSDGLESKYSNSYYSDSENEDSENEDGAQLGDLLLGNQNRPGSKTQEISIQVYDTSTRSKELSPIFHFTHTTVGSLFTSPPVFHPTKPLLVWPLGNNEILFADVSTNTYFTRLLSCTTYTSCQVFIKAHFSPDGSHLHFAALEASEISSTAGPKSAKANIRLNLQVTTHRLSSRKTTRAPPRLIFRTNVSLGKTSRLDVSNLPYALTWRPNDLYVTTRARTLDVIRIPLFAPAPGTTTVPVCYTQKPIFLPRTAASRNVRFFPPSEDGEKGSSKDKQRKKEKATVLIGSHSSMPAQLALVPNIEISPPVGVYLDVERDLGGWKCKANTEFSVDRAEANRAAGRLQGRFEAFDLKDDCDIVPYLF